MKVANLSMLSQMPVFFEILKTLGLTRKSSPITVPGIKVVDTKLQLFVAYKLVIHILPCKDLFWHSFAVYRPL